MGEDVSDDPSSYASGEDENNPENEIQEQDEIKNGEDFNGMRKISSKVSSSLYKQSSEKRMVMNRKKGWKSAIRKSFS
jgi:hypothetical protein